jgi:cyanophycinase
LLEERFSLSEKLDIYMAADKDGAVRVKGSEIDILDNVKCSYD